MGKAVLISIDPEWCKCIAAGHKTLEVRKSRPKLSTPFKVYIYCTVAGHRFVVEKYRPRLGNGKVIGEFVCDSIYTYSTCAIDGNDLSDRDMEKGSCMSKSSLEAYEMSVEPKENTVYRVGLYAWHISDLIIYDEPKRLSEFWRLRNTKSGCEAVKVERAPQSWCYVSEGGDEA